MVKELDDLAQQVVDALKSDARRSGQVQSGSSARAWELWLNDWESASACLRLIVWVNDVHLAVGLYRGGANIVEDGGAKRLAHWGAQPGGGLVSRIRDFASDGLPGILDDLAVDAALEDMRTQIEWWKACLAPLSV